MGAPMHAMAQPQDSAVCRADRQAKGTECQVVASVTSHQTRMKDPYAFAATTHLGSRTTRALYALDLYHGGDMPNTDNG